MLLEGGRTSVPMTYVRLPNIRDRRLWIGTVSGLSELQPGTETVRFRNCMTANGLSGSAIYILQEDRGGNLWIGTQECGVMRMARAGFSTYADR
jgi:ligand-binding sensor domain-containing protein